MNRRTEGPDLSRFGVGAARRRGAQSFDESDQEFIRPTQFARTVFVQTGQFVSVVLDLQRRGKTVGHSHQVETTFQEIGAEQGSSDSGQCAQSGGVERRTEEGSEDVDDFVRLVKDDELVRGQYRRTRREV